MGPKVVLDTNVLVAGLRSRRGASYRLLSLIGTGKFAPCVSVPLVLEYEDVLKREVHDLASEDVDAVLDYVCRVADRRKIHFLWRPQLRDSKDDMLLELAVAARCTVIVTHNESDFRGSERFGVEPLSPRDFLGRIGELP